MSLRSTIKKHVALPWPLLYIYRKVYYAPKDIPAMFGFIFHGTKSPTTFDSRLALVLKFYKISYYVDCPHTEHEMISITRQILDLGAPNGVGLVKLMGRHSGFIAAYASLAMSDVNFVLIPEVPFKLEGECGLLAVLRRRLERRGHAVIAVAEGAGQHLMEGTSHTVDASGNRRLGDIGAFLKERIGAFFKERHVECNLKYIDPSYIIRSVPASPQDNVYCSRLAQNAVHAAMAGKTGMLVGRWHGTFVHLPLDVVTKGRRKVDPGGELWHSVLENTGQPAELY